MAKNKLKSPKKKRKAIQRSNKNIRLKNSQDIVLESPDSRFGSVILLMIPVLFFLWNGLQGVYYEVDDLRISLFLFLCAIIAFFITPKKRTYIFSKERLQIVEKKQDETIVHPFADVIGYYDIETSRKSRKSEELLLKTETKSIMLSSNDENYLLLKRLIAINFDKIHGSIYVAYYLKKKAPYLMLLGIFLMGCFWLDGKHEVASSSALSLTTITLSEKPELEKRYKSFGYDLKFKSKEYPVFTFQIPQSSTKIDLANFSKNDKINIVVEQDVLDMKLLKTKEATFNMKHHRWENISVKGLTLFDQLIQN